MVREPAAGGIVPDPPSPDPSDRVAAKVAAEAIPAGEVAAVDELPGYDGLAGAARTGTLDDGDGTRRLSLLPEQFALLARKLAPTVKVTPGCALGRFTSFQIGGPADLLVEPDSLEALAATLGAAHEAGVPVLCLGGGTNVLVADAGIRGVVVRLGKAFAYIRETATDVEGASLEVGAATRFIRLAKETVSRGLAGLEFAAGIPGSVGGAAQMNAGAFGGEISQTLTSMVYVTAAGEIVEKRREDLQFSYRKLAFEPGAVIASLRFRLLRSSVGRLQQVVARVQEKRRRNQPAGYPNAGSIFKNPPGEFAGRLIEKAGLKGTTKGGAQVSPDHANFIINLGSATASDVRCLMSLVQEEVWTRCGVWLEPEVRLIGDFGQSHEEATSRP